MRARRLLGGDRHTERLLLFLGLVPLLLSQGRGGARRRRVRAPLLVEGARHLMKEAISDHQRQSEAIRGNHVLVEGARHLQHRAAHTREERRTERLAAATAAAVAATAIAGRLGTTLGTTRA